MISPQNMHGSEIIWTEQFIFRNVSAYTYAYVMTINEKKGCGFEGEREGIYKKAFREEREGRKCSNYIIS